MSIEIKVIEWFMHFPVELLIMLCDAAEASESVDEIITKEANSKLFCCFQMVLSYFKNYNFP